MKRLMNVRHRRSVEEIATDIDEAMKDPEFRRIVRDFIKQTTS